MNGDRKGTAKRERIERRLRGSFEGMATDYDRTRFGLPALGYFSELENAAIHRLLGPLKDRRILDVGCGTGRIAIPLSQKGARVIALDLTDEMIKIARGKASDLGDSGISFCLASAGNLPFRQGTFEALTSVRMFHLLPRNLLRPFIKEMASTVQPGGVMVLEFNSAFHGGVIGLARHFQNWIWTHTRNANRTHVLYPWEIPWLFRGLGPVRVEGVYFPTLYRLHRRSPGLAAKIARLGEVFPFKYLTRNLLIHVQIGNGGTP